jgi:hypothetical protein
VVQSLVFCVMVGRFLVEFVWLNLVFCIMVGRLLVGFVYRLSHPGRSKKWKSIIEEVKIYSFNIKSKISQRY